MSTSPSRIPLEQIDAAGVLSKVRLRIFQADADQDSCDQFLEGHRQVLKAAGITRLTSLDSAWVGSPDQTVFMLLDADGDRVLSGMRLMRRSPDNRLPMERAVSGAHPEVSRLIEDHLEEGCGEFCALWSHREAAVAGIGMVPMACAGLGVMSFLDVRHGFAFMGRNMNAMQRSLGFDILKNVGVAGAFDYPAPPIISEIGHFISPESLENSQGLVQNFVRAMAEEPSKCHALKGRFGPVDYHVENNLI